MARRTCSGLSPEAAQASFYRGKLLASVLLPPAEFFAEIVPLYNALNGGYVIEDVRVDYSETIFDAVHGAEV